MEMAGMKYKLSVAVLVGAWSWIGCGITTSGVSTETNWLQKCDGSEECGELSCVCGVCSLPCSESSECDGAPEASECALSEAAADPSQCAPETSGFCRPMAISTGSDSDVGSASTGGVGGSRGGDTGVPPVSDDTSTGGATGVGAGGGVSRCGDAEVDAIFLAKCSASICHGDPDASTEGIAIPALFSPERKTAWLDRPGVYCPEELLIDSLNPAESLLVTTLRRTAACGIRMPIGPMIPDAEIECIEQWVEDVAAAGRGE